MQTKTSIIAVCTLNILHINKQKSQRSASSGVTWQSPERKCVYMMNINTAKLKITIIKFPTEPMECIFYFSKIAVERHNLYPVPQSNAVPTLHKININLWGFHWIALKNQALTCIGLPPASTLELICSKFYNKEILSYNQFII